MFVQLSPSLSLEGVEALNSFSLITSHKFSVRRFSRFVFLDGKKARSGRRAKTKSC